VGLTLGKSKYVYQNIELTMRRGKRESLPNGNEYFILRRLGDGARANISGYIACFDGPEIDENLSWIAVHLAGVDVEQRIVPPIPTGVVGVLGPLPSGFFVGEPGMTVKLVIRFVRGLGSVDMTALYRFVVEDSKLDVRYRKSRMAAFWV